MVESDTRWLDTGLTADMEDGQMVAIQIEEHKIAIYKVAGAFFATDNICTHAYALLTDGWLDEQIVECPLHGGRFDVTTGEALCEPVTCNLRRFDIRLSDSGRLEVRI